MERGAGPAEPDAEPGDAGHGRVGRGSDGHRGGLPPQDGGGRDAGRADHHRGSDNRVALIQSPTGAGAFLSGLEESALAGVVRSSTWLYPGIEIVHIVGFVIL